MFQRPSLRQAGFIRTRQNSQNCSLNVDRSFNCQDGLETLHFSPFKDSSPEPIDYIIQSYRQRQTIIPKLNNFIDYVPKKLQINQIKYRSQQLIQDVPKPISKKRQSDNRAPQRLRPEPVRHEPKKVQKLEVTSSVSLAEAFETNCRRMKQRLEYQRNKFSRSKNKNIQNSEQKINFNLQSLELKPKISDPSERRRKNIQNRNRRANDESDKENCSVYLNMQDPSKSTKMAETKKVLNIETGSTSARFFIPAATSRSKPITPREAYQHSLKKWKQLPEVVAREKEREKQRELKERLSKMKAHSQDVRNKMRR